jgi:hypothetical protein
LRCGHDDAKHREIFVSEREQWAQAVLRVGDGGRGFVVETKRERIVITAAHCLPTLPPPHAAFRTEKRTYPSLLGPLKGRRTVWAECLFADPIADIAVLWTPDNQVFPDEAQAYDALVDAVTPLSVAPPVRLGSTLVRLPADIATALNMPGTHSYRVPESRRTTALILSLTGEWLECSVTRHRASMEIHQGIVKSGMSGSPILSKTGYAVGLVSTGECNPILVKDLPPRIGVYRPRVSI